MINANGIIYGLIVAAVAAVVISYAVLSARIHARDAEIARLKLQLSECVQRVSEADRAVEKQNAAIEAVKVDTIKVTKIINSIAQKYETERTIIEKSIEKDSSCENKFAIIDNVMRGFHGVGVRPENHN